MPVYNPPLRDMQFVMHEVLKVTDDFKAMPQHAEVDVDTVARASCIAMRGGNAAKIAEAERALAEGDALRASGAFKPAVNKYKVGAGKAEGA